MKKIVLLAAVVAMVAALAGPAAAETDVGTFGDASNPTNPDNQAEIGDHFAPGCTKAGTGEPEGRGLTIPQPKDVPPAANPAKDRVYQIDSAVNSVVFGAGTASICGWITNVGGIGPRCGMSKGYGGQGMIVFDEARIKVSNITWKATAGGTLPITGEAHRMDGNTKTKASKLYAIVQAQGGAACATTNKDGGSTGFTVFGVYVIANDADDTLPQWNDVTDNADDKSDGGLWGPKPHDPGRKDA